MVGLGVSSLSSAATAAPLVGATLAGVTQEACEAAAQAALGAKGPAEAREAAAAHLS
jgi:phosphotransferase system enzyme I (PtsI)